VVGISIWSSGLRNNYDSVFTTNEETYIIMNGPNLGSGVPVTGPPQARGCTPQDFDTWDECRLDSRVKSETAVNPVFMPKPWPVSEDEMSKNCQPTLSTPIFSPDRIFRSFEGAYHGHPNPARARNLNDTRQWYHGVYMEAGVNFTEGWAIPSSTTGVTEFRGDCFGGRLRGDLLVAKWDTNIFLVDLPDENNEELLVTDLMDVENYLDIQYAPGCNIIMMGYKYGDVGVISPSNEALTEFERENGSLPEIYDISPWRGPAKYGKPFVIGGRRFTNGKRRKPVEVRIGGVKAEVKNYGDARIEGIIPAQAAQSEVHTSAGLVDVVVHFSDDTLDILRKAFLFLKSSH